MTCPAGTTQKAIAILEKHSIEYSTFDILQEPVSLFEFRLTI